MKSAICISGLARQYRETVSAFYTNLWEPLRAAGQVDVFVSIWDQVGVGTRLAHQGKTVLDVNELMRLYSPMSLEIEPYRLVAPNFVWQRFTSRPCTIYTEGGVCLMVPMQYKVWRANLLKLKAEVLAGSRYDIVVRTRFDLELLTPLRLNEIDPTRVGVMHNVNSLMCDMFYFAGSQEMDAVCNVFPEYPRLFGLQEPDITPERILYNHVRDKGLHTYIPKNLPYALVRDNHRDEWHWNSQTQRHEVLTVKP